MIETKPTLSLTLPAWRRYLAYVTVALMPISINIEKLAGAGARTYFSPLDALLPILALLLIYDLITRKPWARFRWPPISGVLWVAVALLSCLWLSHDSFPSSDMLKVWAKACWNPLLFGVIAVWVFQNIADSAAEFRRLSLILGASFSLCLLLALMQYAGPVGLPYNPKYPTQALGGASHIRVAGWYDFRGILGAHVALLVPVATAFALMDKDVAVRWAAFSLVFVALCVTLAAGGFVGASAGIVAVAVAYAVKRSKLTGLLALSLLALIVGVILPHLPRQNANILSRGLAFYAEDKKDIKPTARLRRHQAALDLLVAPSNPHDKTSAPNWQTGVGAGQYQRHINGFYKNEYPKPGHGTDDEAVFDMEADEPFTFGFLETLTVELGAPGLLLILFLFGSWILSAHGAFTMVADDEQNLLAMLALAAFGTGVGALALSVFANPIIRGVGGSFAFFFALALTTRALATRRDELPACRGSDLTIHRRRIST
ncbi:MAG: hypothetical protein V1899_10215 [Planctomycetota bacterium]